MEKVSAERSLSSTLEDEILDSVQIACELNLHCLSTILGNEKDPGLHTVSLI